MVNPDLHALFFWHFHPEIELVYIEGIDGTRHVGEHMSSFHQSDLVLIGPNIPHLNFDYGATSPYQKRVIHFREHFMAAENGSTPELTGIRRLLEEAQHGVAFGRATKSVVREQLLQLHEHTKFDQFLGVLAILQCLSAADDRVLLHEHPVANSHTHKDHHRLSLIYAFVEDHFDRAIDNHEVAALCHLSPEAFCRYFKRMTRLTFTQFVNQYRIGRAKQLLLLDNNVSETCFSCGFDSLSYFSRTFKKIVGESPVQYKTRIQRQQLVSP